MVSKEDGLFDDGEKEGRRGCDTRRRHVTNGGFSEEWGGSQPRWRDCL